MTTTLYIPMDTTALAMGADDVAKTLEFQTCLLYTSPSPRDS